MPPHQLLILPTAAIQRPPQGVGGDQGAVGASDQHGRVEMADGQAEGERRGAGDADAGVEAAERVDAHVVVLFRRDEGEQRRGEGQDRGRDPGSGREHPVRPRGPQVAQSHVAVDGGAGQEMGVGRVGVADG